MPSRILREGARTSEAIGTLSLGAQSTFFLLLTLVDDYGVYDAGHRLLKSLLFPYRSSEIPQEEFDGWMQELYTKKVVIPFTSPKGNSLLFIRKFENSVRSLPKFELPSISDEKLRFCAADVEQMHSKCAAYVGTKSAKKHKLLPTTSPSNTVSVSNTVKEGVEGGEAEPFHGDPFESAKLSLPHDPLAKRNGHRPSLITPEPTLPPELETALAHSGTPFRVMGPKKRADVFALLEDFGSDHLVVELQRCRDEGIHKWFEIKESIRDKARRKVWAKGDKEQSKSRHEEEISKLKFD